MKTDRTLLLFSGSVPLFSVSLLLPPFSVHTYCENRVFGLAFGAASVALFYLFARNCAETKTRKVLSGIGTALCVIATVANVAFVAYATHLCRHTFDNLK